MAWSIDEWDVMRMPWPVESESVQCIVTSPPYWGLRDYGVAGQLGLERTPEEYVEKMVAVFREVRRVLRKDGTVWLNLGDCYNAYNGGAGPGSKLSGNQTKARPHLESGYGLRTVSLKPKDLVGIPWRVSFALQADGWWLRSDIVWAKPNPMPESVRDRPTRAHEYVFLLTKEARYFYAADAIRTGFSSETKGLSHETMDFKRRDKYKTPDGWDTRRGQGGHGSFHRNGREKGQKQPGHSRRHAGFNDPWDALSKEQQETGGANARTVWSIAMEPFPEAHFATFPTELARRCILAGSSPGDLVLDPFAGSGTTILVADMVGRDAIGLELNPSYVEMARARVLAPRSYAEAQRRGKGDAGQMSLLEP